jgi:hypothetical protein
MLQMFFKSGSIAGTAQTGIVIIHINWTKMACYRCRFRWNKYRKGNNSSRHICRRIKVHFHNCHLLHQSLESAAVVIGKGMWFFLEF